MMDVSVLVLVISALIREGLASETCYLNKFTFLSRDEASKHCKTPDDCITLLNCQGQWDNCHNYLNCSKCSIRDVNGNVLEHQVCLPNKWVSDRMGQTCSVWKKKGGDRRGANNCHRHRDQRTHISLVCTGMNARCENVTSDARPTSQNTPTSVVTSAVETTTQTTPAHVVNGSCGNCCAKNNTSRQLNQEELKNAIQELKSQLAVNKTNLSANRRKRTSVYDSRSSSVAIGGVAIAILAGIGGVIVIPDMVRLVRSLSKCPHKCKHKTSLNP